jgi:O-antigen ligase
VSFVPKKWNLLVLIVSASYIVLDLIATRNPIVAITTRLVMNAQTAYFRSLIFHFGIQNVWANPLFGIGVGDWARPSWMPPSVDNFWLLTAMRHGVPGFLFVALAIASLYRTVGRSAPVSETVAAQRKALLFSMTGICLAIGTVHLWGATVVLFMFLLGSGMWIADAAVKTPAAADTKEA